jgi:predicted acyl esterase
VNDRSATWEYAVRRLKELVVPPVVITPPPDGVRVERDVAVTVRDGTVLRVNVFRPDDDARHPVILSAHPYGKDNLPTPRRRGGYAPPFQYRVSRQPAPVRFSAWTGWEAPDPGYWAPRGYAVVNADLRGFGRSDGVGTLMSDAEARDYYDLVEWAGGAPWSNGRVGLSGVSYLALSQWRVAALRPPHLAAICPWEGFSDLYRDFAYPGGVREDAFVVFWNRMVRRQGRSTEDLRAEQLARPQWDDWWASRAAPLESIEVPALICASFSDQNLHSRGSFEGFRRIASREKWLYTHRDGKWAAYYSPEALAFQARFFDCFLKGADNGMRAVPPVRLEVRASGDAVDAVRFEQDFPLARTAWTPLYLRADGALSEARGDGAGGEVAFETRRGRASFVWTAPDDVELSGPMKLRLYVEARAGADDLHVFAGVRKLRDGAEVVFEGSYGFGHDMVTRGWLRVSHRELDPAASRPWRPVHTHRRAEPLRPGEVVPVELELLPSATRFRRGEQLRLDVQGRWFYRRDPLFGQFQSGYAPSPRGVAVLHVGGGRDAHLLVPLVPRGAG